MDAEEQRTLEARYREITEKITKLIHRRELLRLKLREDWEGEGFLPDVRELITAASEAAGVDPVRAIEAGEKVVAPLLAEVDVSWFWTNKRILASIVKGVIEAKEAAEITDDREPNASVQDG